MKYAKILKRLYNKNYGTLYAGQIIEVNPKDEIFMELVTLWVKAEEPLAVWVKDPKEEGAMLPKDLPLNAPQKPSKKGK